MRHENGYALVANFFVVCAPLFGVLVPLGSFSSSTVLGTIPKFDMMHWSLLQLSSQVSSKMRLKRQVYLG